MEAEKRILATLKWRRANGIDELLSTDEWELPAKLKEQHKVQLVALKGQIQPVWYIPVGTANFKGKSTILVLLFCPYLIKVANARYLSFVQSIWRSRRLGFFCFNTTCFLSWSYWCVCLFSQIVPLFHGQYLERKLILWKLLPFALWF